MTHTHSHLMKSASIASLIVASILVIVKTWAWVYTGSLSLFASLIDSLLDILVSMINFMAIRLALKPASDSYRFGFTSIEDVVGLLQAAFMLGLASFVVLEGIDRMAKPVEIIEGGIAMAVMGISLVLTLCLVGYQRYVISKTRSLVVESDSLHYISDFLTNLAVLISLYLSTSHGITYADPLFALGIAAFIIHSSIKIGYRAFTNLLGKELAPKEKARILEIVRSDPAVKGIHDLKTRYSGLKPFIQFHLELDGNLTLSDAHVIAERVEAMLQKEFPSAEIILHQDPAEHYHHKTPVE